MFLAGIGFLLSGSKSTEKRLQLSVLMLSSLLTRYDLLYSEESPVRLDKVSFDGSTISAGLRAKTGIMASFPVLSTSSSMSSDLIPESLKSISVIESGPEHKGPLGPRLILGPLRFANHDCHPNTQVSKGVVRRKAIYANLCTTVQVSEEQPCIFAYVDQGHRSRRTYNCEVHGRQIVLS